MHPIFAISMLYGLMTLGTISILFFSFKGKIDFSARYFLLAEVLMSLTVAYLAMISAHPNYKLAWVSFLGNAIYFAAELSILFSIYALTHRVSIKKYLYALILAASCSGLIEIGRLRDPDLPILISPLIYSLISIATYVLCIRITDEDLRNNLFLKWFQSLQLALIGICLLRVGLYASGVVISPYQAENSTIIMLAIYTAINVFRYFSYQSIRMTWVPNASSVNILNRNLAKSTHENNLLVDGLMRSNRMLGMSALAGSLAHQLSQPLTGAALETESIKRDLAMPGRQAEATAALNKVSLQLSKLSQLVKNLRRLLGRQDEKFQEVSLTLVCDEILDLIQHALAAKKVVVDKEYRAYPVIHGDPIQIQQVVINLLNNAIEAVNDCQQEHRQVILRVDQIGDVACLTVEDNGPGIPNELLTTMFDLYKTTKHGGMGIGLWLSQTIISRHQGQISASNKPDGGALFEVKLPLAQS